jgi:hypothetical protein
MRDPTEKLEQLSCICWAYRRTTALGERLDSPLVAETAQLLTPSQSQPPFPVRLPLLTSFRCFLTVSVLFLSLRTSSETRFF